MPCGSQYCEDGEHLASCLELCVTASFQLFSSKDFKCGEEILTIAAMTSVQVGVLV